MDIIFAKASFSGPNLTTVGTCIGETASVGFTQSGKQIIRVAYTAERGRALAENYSALTGAGIYATITLGVDQAGELATVLDGIGASVGLNLPSTAYTEYIDQANITIENLVIDARTHTKSSIRAYNCPNLAIRNCLVFGNSNADGRHSVVISRCDGANIDQLNIVGGSAQAFASIGSNHVSLTNCSAGGVDCISETYGAYPGDPWTYPDLAALWYDPDTESWAFNAEDRFKSGTNLGGWIGDPDLVRLHNHGGGRYIYLDLSGISEDDNKNERKSLVDRTWLIRTASETISATCVYWNGTSERAVLDAGISVDAGTIAWYCFDEDYRPSWLYVSNLRVVGKNAGSSTSGISIYHTDNFVIDNIYGENLNDYVAGSEFCRRGLFSRVRAGTNVDNSRIVELTFYSEDIHVRSAQAAGFWSHGCPVIDCSTDCDTAAQSSPWSSTSSPTGDEGRMVNWYDNTKINSSPMSVPALVTVTDPPLSQPFDPVSEGVATDFPPP